MHQSLVRNAVVDAVFVLLRGLLVHCRFVFPLSCPNRIHCSVSLTGSWVQDYYNLVDVYLDAVLQPRCVTDPKTFAQEGWHYELEDPKARPSSVIKLHNNHPHLTYTNMTPSPHNKAIS